MEMEEFKSSKPNERKCTEFDIYLGTLGNENGKEMGQKLSHVFHKGRKKDKDNNGQMEL